MALKFSEFSFESGREVSGVYGLEPIKPEDIFKVCYVGNQSHGSF